MSTSRMLYSSLVLMVLMVMESHGPWRASITSLCLDNPSKLINAPILRWHMASGWRKYAYQTWFHETWQSWFQVVAASCVTTTCTCSKGHGTTMVYHLHFFSKKPCPLCSSWRALQFGSKLKLRYMFRQVRGFFGCSLSAWPHKIPIWWRQSHYWCNVKPLMDKYLFPGSYAPWLEDGTHTPSKSCQLHVWETEPLRVCHQEQDCLQIQVIQAFLVYHIC